MAQCGLKDFLRVHYSSLQAPLKSFPSQKVFFDLPVRTNLCLSEMLIEFSMYSFSGTNVVVLCFAIPLGRGKLY